MMHRKDVIISKVWWSRKFALRWRPDWMSFWRTADLFDTIQEAQEARAKFLHANGVTR